MILYTCSNIGKTISVKWCSFLDWRLLRAMRVRIFHTIRHDLSFRYFCIMCYTCLLSHLRAKWIHLGSYSQISYKERESELQTNTPSNSHSNCTSDSRNSNAHACTCTVHVNIGLKHLKSGISTHLLSI